MCFACASGCGCFCSVLDAQYDSKCFVFDFFFFAIVCFVIDTFANVCAGKAVTCICLCWELWGGEPVKIFAPPLIPVMVMRVVLS